MLGVQQPGANDPDAEGLSITLRRWGFSVSSAVSSTQLPLLPGKATKRPCTEEQDRRGFGPRKQIYAPFLSRCRDGYHRLPQARRDSMRKFVFALATFGAIGAACSLAWSATIPAPGPNYSPIQKAACGAGPRCPWGRTWVCGPAGCWCAPCGRGYWYRPWRY